ncbi:hypothetical protein G2W53_027120 [Senna tora]|uniref:BED-type domain-containing protein n=1 Tax=Senna tora TaxID=362788 RepID=A0A834TIR2_9FABA|nr:hypothetical protein G2W53_027120 [Senna tora]
MATSEQQSTASTPSTQSVRSRADPAWEYCIEMTDPNGKKIWKCMYCEKQFKGGGIHRIKQHLAGKKGDATKKKGPNDLKNMQASEDNTDSSEVPPEPNTQIAVADSSQRGIKRKSNADDSSFFAPRTTLGAQPSIKYAMAGKEAVRRADMAIARFFYDNCIPMNVANSVYYQPMIDAIASIGSGYKGPTYQALRTNVLHDMKKEVTLLVEACRSRWSESGCTIMADGWQDRKNRQLINFLVYCPRGDIGKMGLVSSLAKRASMITKFVYNQAYLLAWLRKRDGWTEIIRPGPTRFATTFIALKSIHEHKHDLQALVTSKTFTESRYSRDQKAKEVIAIVLDNKFWSDCGIVVQIVAPLMRMLRIVDADNRPSLGYVYDGMYRARKTIKNVFMNKKSLYKPYTRIVKQRWDRQLRHSVHAAAYLLNPVFYYDKANFSKKPEVMEGFLQVLGKIVTHNKTRFVEESMLYRNREGRFNSDLAIESSSKMKPDTSPFLDYDELENMIYDQQAVPIIAIEEAYDTRKPPKKFQGNPTCAQPNLRWTTTWIPVGRWRSKINHPWVNFFPMQNLTCICSDKMIPMKQRSLPRSFKAI